MMRSMIVLMSMLIFAAHPALGWNGLSIESLYADKPEVQMVLGITINDPIDERFIGLHVYRSIVGDCSVARERITAELIPFPVSREQHIVTDTLPFRDKAYSYEARCVDVDGVDHDVDYIGIYTPIQPMFVTWGHAPVTKGQLIDWGWTIALYPCSGECWPFVYGVWAFPEVLEWAGTGQVVSLYGSVTCGTMEGCEIWMSGIEPSTCGVTEIFNMDWGDVKRAYR
jgi:hypothetical protein